MQRSDPAIRLRSDKLRDHGRRLGLETDAAMAAHLRVSHSTLSRLFNGDIGPGENTIAAALTAFPDLRFEDLFEVMDRAAASSNGDGAAA